MQADFCETGQLYYHLMRASYCYTRQLQIFCKTSDAVELAGGKSNRLPVIRPKTTPQGLLSMLSPNTASKMCSNHQFNRFQPKSMPKHVWLGGILFGLIMRYYISILITGRYERLANSFKSSKRIFYTVNCCGFVNQFQCRLMMV